MLEAALTLRNRLFRPNDCFALAAYLLLMPIGLSAQVIIHPTSDPFKPAEQRFL